MNLYQRAALRSSHGFKNGAVAPMELNPGYTIRAVSIGQAKDPENIRWILATEQPAKVYDWQLDRVVDEVLLMDGVVYPQNMQVPLLDCHNRWTCDDQLGSVSGFKSETAGEFSAISGLVKFASDDRSLRTKQKVLDGHLTDGSAGYRVLASIWIPEGVEATVRGRAFKGPLKVSTDWILKEFTLTPIGADSLSKFMGSAGQLA